VYLLHASLRLKQILKWNKNSANEFKYKYKTKKLSPLSGFLAFMKKLLLMLVYGQYLKKGINKLVFLKMVYLNLVGVYAIKVNSF
jgi:hypothetical protein